MSKKLKKIISVAAPIAAAFIPGIGPLAAAGIGAASGALGGGGLKGALLGAVAGGGGKFLSGSGFLGSAAGSALDKVSGIAGLQGPTQGSGLIGAVSRGTSGLSSALKGALGGTGSSGGLSLNNLGTIASGIKSYGTQDDLEEQLLAAQGKAAGALDPFYNSGLGANNQLADRLKAGFNPGDLTQDPGYKFRIEEGQRGLDRAFAAGGMTQSGAALKAATEYGQGVADQTYNDAYQRWLAQNSQLAGQSGQGQSAASGLGDIYTNQGNIGANADLARNNILSSTLSSALSGGGKSIIGYDREGNPIYAQ